MLSSPQQETKLWFGASMLLIGVIVGFAGARLSGATVVTQPTPAPAQQQQQKPPAAPPAETAPNYSDIPAIDAKADHIRGTPGAVITIIEYSDLECPFCARVHPTIKQAMEQYPGKVNWIYRHYPLPFHANAQKAAEASECAAELGGNDKFWAMVDMIYEKGSDNAQLGAYAKAIGLNETTFSTCLSSGKFATKIKDMMAGGSKIGVSGTPGNIIVNNQTKQVKVVTGAQPIDNFKTAIDALLAGK